jgi:hypothetical protein
MAEIIPLVFDNFNPNEEEQIARLFCHSANTYFEGIEGKIYVLPNLKTQRELDLVVWMTFPKYKPTIKTGYISINSESKQTESKTFRTRKDVWFNSSLLIFELKKHNTSDSISIRNGSISVLQQNGFHNASNQSFEQVHPLKNFLAEKINISEREVPRIINLIWLYRWGEIKPEGYEDVENLILGEINFDSLLEQLCKLNQPVEYSNNKGIYNYGGISETIIAKMNNFFEDRRKEKANGIGNVSREKLNQIIKKDIDAEHSSYFKDIGKKIIILKGKPGTGKTIHLINLAYHCKELEFTPIVLTFNRALSQDIDRLMEYSGYGGLIQIKTLHQFFIQILKNIGLIDEITTEIFYGYTYINLLNDLMDLIKDSSSSLEIRKELGAKFDLVLVDEAQDCDEIERDLIIKIFGINNCVVSIGNRQIVRKKMTEVNWALGTNIDERNLVNLRISHRNKKDLTDFFNSFSKIHFNSKQWELKENRNLNGGNLILLNTKEYKKSFQIELDNKLIENKNSKYDLMFLTPNKESDKDYAVIIRTKLDDWNYKSWIYSGFNKTTEEESYSKFPIDAYRIMNYQSCRGLEAWTLVIWNLDVIIQNIKFQHVKDFPETSESETIEQINNWLLMIFTRAIDTLVITFEDTESEEYLMIVNLVKSNSFEHMAKLIDSN